MHVSLHGLIILLGYHDIIRLDAWAFISMLVLVAATV